MQVRSAQRMSQSGDCCRPRRLSGRSPPGIAARSRRNRASRERRRPPASRVEPLRRTSRTTASATSSCRSPSTHSGRADSRPGSRSRPSGSPMTTLPDGLSVCAAEATPSTPARANGRLLLGDVSPDQRDLRPKLTDLSDRPAVPLLASPFAAPRRPLGGRASEPQQRHDRPVVAPGHLDDRRQPHHRVRVAHEHEHLLARRVADAADPGRDPRADVVPDALVRRRVLAWQRPELADRQA